MPSSRGSSRPQGSNPRLLHLLHRQADSVPLAPPGTPPPVGETDVTRTCRWSALCSFPELTAAAGKEAEGCRVDLGQRPHAGEESDQPVSRDPRVETNLQDKSARGRRTSRGPPPQHREGREEETRLESSARGRAWGSPHQGTELGSSHE